jgi:hypothetical protein
MSKNWKQQALAATSGSQFGAILSSALGEKIEAPCFTSKAVVTSDGFVQANFVGKDGRAHLGAFVGAATDLVDNIKDLASHLKLSEKDRAELFAAVRGWVATDYSGRALERLR